MVIQRIELADGTALPLAEAPTNPPRKRAPIVDGYCVHCGTFAKGPRYEPSTPSDRVDWISDHPGCPKQAGA